MPTVLWHDEEANGYTDCLPAEWFAAEGLLKAHTHRVIGPRGGTHQARCDVTVKGTTAELNYQAHGRFNTDRGMCLGVMRLQFTGPDRRAIAQVWWRDQSSDFQPASTTVGLDPEESREGSIFREGGVHWGEVDRYERDPLAREACIRHHGVACSVCGFDFRTAYGPVAAGFIHVHHLRALSEYREEHEVDPIADLRPVCPNCHAVLHLGGKCRSIEDVKQLVEQSRAFHDTTPD